MQWTTLPSLRGLNGKHLRRSSRSWRSGWTSVPWVTSRRKPTTLGTNIKYLQQLEGLADRRPAGGLQPVTNSLGQRTSESRSWAAWPVDFKVEVTKGILLELEEYKSRGGCGDGPSMLAAKMTSEQWRQHVINDHRAILQRVHYVPSGKWEEPTTQEGSTS